MAGGVLKKALKGLNIGSDTLHTLKGTHRPLDRLKDPQGVPGPGMFDPTKMTWEEYLQQPPQLQGPLAAKMKRALSSPVQRRKKKPGSDKKRGTRRPTET